MATYLALMRWTKEGIEKIKDSPARLDAARKAIEPGRREACELLHVDGSI